VDSKSQDSLAQDAPLKECGSFSLPVHIFATQDEYLVEVEMQGIDTEALEIVLDGNDLTISGRRSPPSAEEGSWTLDALHFRRLFKLHEQIDVQKINAALHYGLLRLRFPIPEQVQPRKISITE